MGIFDAVAEDMADFARIGKWLVADHAAREALRARILAASPVLFEDRSVLQSWETVLQDAVTRRIHKLQARAAEATPPPPPPPSRVEL
jgi:hypothetical protein